MIERVLIVLSYHDGPIEGISCGEQSGHYFHALFREDLDEYDDVFSIMALDDATRREAQTLLADANVKDPVLRDPTRRAFVYALRAKFDALLEARSAEIRRCLPNFHTLTGGVSGEYDVAWQDVEAPARGDRGMG